MAWRKPSPELIEFLAEQMKESGAQVKMMFGSPTYFINDNMLAGVHQESLFVRLSAEDRERLVDEYDEVVPFEPMEGRVMKEYVVLPESVYNEHFEDIIDRAINYVRTLPPKEPKKKRKKRSP